MARPTKTKAMERLRKALNGIPELKGVPRCSPAFEKWRRNAEVAVANAFGNESSHVADFKNIRYSLIVVGGAGTPDSKAQAAYARRVQAAYVKGLDSAASILESMLEEIEEYWEEEEQSSRIFESGGRPPKSTNKVFVIHGHDESAREMVARFLEKLELVPIILHEQPNKGRTIIEKFEEYADVRFAVVLLTPDDEGAVKTPNADLRPRARQNVVFEFGFFIGRLGRERVCALAKGDIERPSDSDGILYVSLDDNDGWKLRLLRELNAAGFVVDANLALSA
jgi:hypothetical protein